LFFPVCLLIILFFLPSCAMVKYNPPGQGTSAELQSAFARSLEEGIRGVAFDPKGKSVAIHVQAIGGFRKSQGLEKYVRSLFQEWVVEKGGTIGTGEFRMDVFLPVLGTTATRRDLSYQHIPLYYSERFRITQQMIVRVRDAKGGIVGIWQGGQKEDQEDIYLMRIFGPFDLPF
jgi:hypothetical protein